MRTINIGKLNKRITILKLQDTEDDMGQNIKKLMPVSNVWATITPIRGNEYYEVRKIQGKTTHKIYIRYTNNIDTSCKIQYQDKIFDIDSILDIDLDNKLLEIQAIERVGKEVMELWNQ